ncbi:MAG: RHS repeat protein [Chlamydiales bacterium]|nr:RHS repeat protein [Chlamydiales bacterium]
MRKKILLSILITLSLSLSIFAEEDEGLDVAGLEVSKDYVLDQQENHFLTSTGCRINPKVNPLTGEYCEEEIDLVIAGSQPLSLRRFYNHTTPEDPRYARWRYNPECLLVANLEWDKDFFAAIGENDGSILSLKPSGRSRIFTFQPEKGFIHSSGSAHPLNYNLSYEKIQSPKDKRSFQFKGIIADGTGRIRTFLSPMHRWHKKAVYTKRKKHWYSTGADITYTVYPAYWTPYHLPIREEKLPNGNIICYTYEPWSDAFDVPHPNFLSTITAYNADKTKVLGFLHFSYTRGKDKAVKYITVEGSDGRKVVLAHEVREVRPENKRWQEARITDTVLKKVSSPSKPDQSYTYRWEDKRHYFDAPFLYQCTTGSFPLKTDYDLTAKKVRSQSAPVGPNGEMSPIARYDYQNGATVVFDAENNQTIYRYDTDKTLTSIERYQGKSLYRIDRFTWDPSTGNLTRKTIEGKNGIPLQIIEYKYDKNHNPILERVGDGKEWRTIERTYSDDGFNLKLTESDGSGKIIRYTYVPNTNLLSSELTYENQIIRKRVFHTYDDCAICINTIIDDGATEDLANLQGVTYRKITQITPKYSMPCFGLPECIEEKTIDSSGQEILLSRIVYSYTPFGEILQEEHYDANGDFSYSLNNTYDAQERLISKTNPLGAKTTYTYDANHNVTSIAGPRPDQYREIAYDKANRPIRIANWQTDGTVIITEKRYDKLGQVIEEIDPCGEITRFEYDALGRVTAVHHPDGAIERKEYDLLGNVIKEIDPEGYETTKTYNPYGQPLSIHYLDGSEERFTYNAGGTIRSHTDKNGATTNYTYDIFDHPICKEIRSATGMLLKRVTSTWSPFQKLSEIEDDLSTRYTYDFAGRKIAENQAYRLTEYLYDPSGRLSCTKSEETCQITEYDLCGRPTQIRTEDEGLIQKQEGYAYDEAGNRIHTVTSQGVKETHYNTDGKPLSIKDPLGDLTCYSYSYEGAFTQTKTNPKGIQTIISHDARRREVLRVKKNTQGQIIQQSETRYNLNGNPIQVIHLIFSGVEPVRTITHTWEYGPLDRLERFIEAGEKETRYLYDSKGRLEAIIKPDGSRLTHTYDDLGRLIRYNSHDFDYTYTYDSHGRVILVADQTSRTLRVYDPIGNILKETLANGLTLSNTYDTQGRRLASILPDMSAITYRYKGIYLHSVSRNGLTHTYTDRNLEGQIVRARTPAGEIEIKRDLLGRYASIQAPYFSAQDYVYDPAGNLLSYLYRDQAGQIKHHYRYDELDQIIQEDERTYNYDSIHNRLIKESYAYAVNTLSQVISDGERTYAYDPCGNIISDGARIYTYDSLDRLIAVQEGEHKTGYTYDPFHRRLSKTTYQSGRKLKTIRYLWDGKHEIGSVDEHGNLIELRVLGESLGAEIGGAVLYELQDQIFVPIHDHRGSVVVLVDHSTQAPIEHYRYTAFGEEETGHTLSPWRFSSKRTDEETGLIYFGRRYYNPALGRWITQDPQGFEDAPNLYAYVHNNPLTEIDLYGLWSIGQALSGLSHMAFRSLEWTGANLLPVPYVRNVVESIGRWGAGGDFQGPSRYRTGQNEIITIPGRTISGRSYTHGNGMLTRKEDAIKQAEYISRTHGELQVDLLYHGTEGFIMDLIGCGLSKVGIPTAYNKMCASYYSDKLRDDPNHRFTSSVHSRGGIQMMNTGRLLTHAQRQQIDVISYGSATLIPKGFFRSAKNNLSALDLVTMTNPLAFSMGLLGRQFDVNILTPSTRCPVKAHGFLEATYAEEIERRGRVFQKFYFSD